MRPAGPILRGRHGRRGPTAREGRHAQATSREVRAGSAWISRDRSRRPAGRRSAASCARPIEKKWS